MAELPDDIVEQVRDELGMVLSVGSVRVLRAFYPLIAARVRAEAVAAERQATYERLLDAAQGAMNEERRLRLVQFVVNNFASVGVAGSVPVATPSEDSRITNQSGHEFTFTIESRGEGMNWSHTMVPQTVRAWNLRDAIAVIAALPFASWFPVQGDEPVDEVVCPSCGTRIRARMTDTEPAEQSEGR